MPRNLNSAVSHAIDATNQLDGFGIDLPPEAARWLKKLLELRANQPEEAPPNRVAELIADSAKQAEIDKAVTYKVGQHFHAGQHQLARQLVGSRVLDALLNDRARLHTELAVHADAVIERLHHAAAITESIIELTKARRVDDAHALATASADAEDLRLLYATRDNYLTPLGTHWSTGWWSCAHFENPWEIAHPVVKGSSKWDLWSANIRAGGRMWFVPIEQAHAASQPHEPTDMLPPINPRHTGTATFAR